MPLYDYRCPQGHVTTIHRSFEQYRESLKCECGQSTELVVLSPPRVFGDYAGYESPASGKWIEGRRAREEDFRRTGTRPYELGERQEMLKRRAANERALDKKVDEVVDKTLYEMTA